MRLLPGFAFVVLLLPAPGSAAEAFALRKDVELLGSAAAGAAAPLFLWADRVESSETDVVEASGQVEARQAEQNFRADWLRYDTRLNSIEARGNIHVERPEIEASGSALKFNLDTYAGELVSPVYHLPDRQARGRADRIDFLDKNHYRLDDATYTTCPAGNDDWYLDVGKLDIDRARNVGVARNASLHFMGAPILYTPWLDFPLNDARKSGLLPPTLGTTERGGVDILVPYYVNLAPNYDLTLYPRLLTKRGTQLGAEFRHLLPWTAGQNRLEYLPDDNEANRNRWSASLKNTFTVDEHTQIGVDYNRVSDNDYFRDLSNLISVTSRTHLSREAWIATQQDTWNAEFRVQRFQTLQDSTAAPVDEPYERLPQARLNLARPLPHGLEFSLETEATNFAHGSKVDGTRAIAYPRLRLPLTHAAGFLTPQVGWHSSYYSLDNTATDERISRNLPILSVDSGTTFERPLRFGGGDFTQTLEPRAYYVYAPFREQDDIPVFDTAQLDFSYAQMFTENQFVGGDRINDANQLTLAATSRFSEARSGLERLQLTFGQRYYFSSQKVTLPGVRPRTRNATDLLAAAGGQITRDWRFDAAWQFDTEVGETIRQNFSAAYRPAPGRTLNFGYRFIDQTTEQADFSMQWPLAKRWYGMARYNYSFQDDKLVEGLAGLEYNGGCWSVRGVFQRLATKENQSTDTIFLQLELNGFGRLGANPLDVLKQSVPGYRTSNDILTTP